MIYSSTFKLFFLTPPALISLFFFSAPSLKHSSKLNFIISEYGLIQNNNKVNMIKCYEAICEEDNLTFFIHISPDILYIYLFPGKASRFYNSRAQFSSLKCVEFQEDD